MDTPEWTIREATIGDASDVAAIIRAAFAEHAQLDPPSSAVGETEDCVRERLREGQVMLAEIQGVPVGCVAYEPRKDYLYFGRLAVLPEYRARGVGAALIEYVEQQARAQGFRRIRLGVRLALKPMRARYERLGYRVVEERAHIGYSVPTWVIMEKSFWRAE